MAKTGNGRSSLAASVYRGEAPAVQWVTTWERDLPGGERLFDSYHCSRYNTNTRRLTEEMFVRVMTAARDFARR